MSIVEAVWEGEDFGGEGEKPNGVVKEKQNGVVKEKRNGFAAEK